MFNYITYHIFNTYIIQIYMYCLSMYVYCTVVCPGRYNMWQDVTGSLVANWFDMLSIWVRTTFHSVSNIMKRNFHIYQMSKTPHDGLGCPRVQGCESTHWRFAGALLEELTARKLQAKLTSNRVKSVLPGGCVSLEVFSEPFFKETIMAFVACVGPK